MTFSCDGCGLCCSLMMARTLTLSDIARMRELFPDVDEKSFVSSFVCVLDYEEDDPFTDERWFSRLKNGKKVTLALHSWGPCQFLNGKKCVVHERRPWMCRMFPFWFDPELKVRKTARSYCSSLKERPSPEPHPLLEECALAAVPERVETLNFFRETNGEMEIDEFVDAVVGAVREASDKAEERLAFFQRMEENA